VSQAQNSIVHLWKWWFTPRSSDPAVVYRERALRVLLPIITLLRILGTIQTYSGAPDLPKPYAPQWIYLAFFIIPLVFSFYFLARQKVDWAGAFFILHWYLTDMLSLPAEGYWYPGYQISIIIQAVLGTLFLPSRAILPFLIFQLTTIGIWGNWLDIHYYDPPLLSLDRPVTGFWMAFTTLAAQEAIIVFIVRYLRMEMEKSLRLQQVTIKQLQAEITDRQQIEERLRKSEARHRSLLENIPAITYLVGAGQEPLNPTIYISPQIEKITGYASEEFFKDPLFWTNVIHPDDRVRVIAKSERADLTGEPLVDEYRVITNENKTFWFHDESVLVKDDRGKPLYRVGVWTDITERKQSELALQRSEGLYRRAIDAAGAVPYVFDHATRTITFIGEGILPMTGYSASEMMSSGVWNSVVQEGFPRGNLAHLTYEEADRITDEDNSIPWECDFRIRTRDGQTHWIADTSVKGFDEKSGHFLAIGIKQDITERKLAEEMREKLVKELEQRNAELERFAYTLSHELKSPLITIKGFLGYLREDAFNGNSTRLESDIQRIGDGTEKMQRLITELLELLSIGRIVNPFEEISFRTLVDEAVDLVHERIVEQGIAVHMDNDLPLVYGDHKRLVEVLQNLIENSTKYMGNQSEPRIEIGQQAGEDNMPVFFVHDNGNGIEPRFKDRIFDIFAKLDAQSEGTGIGLALVKRIIEIHGGKIWVESEGIGKGSTFYFTIQGSRK
jgi:PAS domain S-box-containing protein